MIIPSTLKTLLLVRFITAIAHIATILLSAIIFLHKPFEFNAIQIASLIGVFALADRGTALLWTFFLPRLSYKKSLLIGNLLCFLAIFGIAIFHQYLWCLSMLFITGLGLSLESLVTRLWISNIPLEEKRIHGFGWLHRIMNGGYLIGSAAAFVLPVYKQATFVFVSIALIYLFSFLVVACFFSEDSQKVKTDGLRLSLKHNFSIFREHFSYILFCLIVFFLGMYAICQAHILPFFFEKFDKIPSYLGWVFASNSFLVLCFQGQMTKLFNFLHKKSTGLGISLGFLLFGSAFFLFGIVKHPVALWLFVALLTMGEMLIIPHVDYLLSLRLSLAIRPIIFSLMGMTFAVGRAVAESGGILGLNYLSEKGLPENIWWFFNAAVFGVFAVSCFWMMWRVKTMNVQCVNS